MEKNLTSFIKKSKKKPENFTINMVNGRLPLTRQPIKRDLPVRVTDLIFSIYSKLISTIDSECHSLNEKIKILLPQISMKSLTISPNNSNTLQCNEENGKEGGVERMNKIAKSELISASDSLDKLLEMVAKEKGQVDEIIHSLVNQSLLSAALMERIDQSQKIVDQLLANLTRQAKLIKATVVLIEKFP